MLIWAFTLNTTRCLKGEPLNQISRRIQLAIPGPGPWLGLVPRDEVKEVNQNFTQLGTHPLGDTIRNIKNSVVCDIVISEVSIVLFKTNNFHQGATYHHYLFLLNIWLLGCYLASKVSPGCYLAKKVPPGCYLATLWSPLGVLPSQSLIYMAALSDLTSESPGISAKRSYYRGESKKHRPK